MQGHLLNHYLFCYDVLRQTEYYAAFTHNHPEGITETAMDIPDKNLREIVARFYGKYIHV